MCFLLRVERPLQFGMRLTRLTHRHAHVGPSTCLHRNKLVNCTFEGNRGHALYVYAGTCFALSPLSLFPPSRVCHVRYLGCRAALASPAGVANASLHVRACILIIVSHAVPPVSEHPLAPLHAWLRS